MSERTKWYNICGNIAGFLNIGTGITESMKRLDKAIDLGVRIIWYTKSTKWYEIYCGKGVWIIQFGIGATLSA